MAAPTHPLNQKSNQLKIASFLAILGVLPLFFETSDTIDTLSGVCFGIAAVLFLAALSKQKIWPEKQV